MANNEADKLDWESLPYHQKIQHKSWQARVSGYEELTKILSSKSQLTAEALSRYSSTCQSFPLETIEVVKSKALEALLVLLDIHFSSVKRAVGDIATGVVNKCLAGKTKTRELAFKILCTCIEIEQHEVTLDALYTGMENKQPKVVLACVECVRINLHDFGIKVLAPKKLMSKITKVLDHKDASVRKEAKLCMLELFRWVPDHSTVIASVQQNIKSVILSELENDWTALKAEGEFVGVPTKYLRSQRPLDNDGFDLDGVTASVDEEKDDELTDELDLTEPTDLKVPADYFTRIISSKWQDRRDALSSLKTLLPSERMDIFLLSDSMDYSQLIRSLHKVITTDTNVILVVAAAQCLEPIAYGLKNGRMNRSLMLQCIEGCLERSREKKANVVDALRKTANAVMSTDLQQFEVVLTEVLNNLADNKVPGVKQSVHILIRQTLSESRVKVNKKLGKTVADVLLKNVGVADSGARDSAFQALAQLITKVGDGVIDSQLSTLDSTKMAKVEGYLNEYKSVAPKVTAKVVKPATPAPVVAANTVKKPQPPKPTKGKPAKKIKASNTAPSQIPSSVLAKESPLELEAAETIAEGIVGTECFSKLSETDWKVRLEAVSSFIEKVKAAYDQRKDSVDVQALVLTICKKKPGMKESNFQIMRARMDLIGFLAHNFQFGKCSLDACVSDLIDKLADVKNSQSSRETLLFLCESTSPFLLLNEYVIKQLVGAKNPKLVQAGADFVCQVIDSFGCKQCTHDAGSAATFLRLIGQLVKGCACNTTSQVRGCGVLLSKCLSRHFGSQQVKSLLSGLDIPTNGMQLIESELDKSKEEEVDKPTRKVRSFSLVSNAVEKVFEDADGREEDGDEVDDDLVPVLNITNHDLVDNNLLSQLCDSASSWKVRNEAAQKLIDIFQTQQGIRRKLIFEPPSLFNDLLNALKSRINGQEPNKVIISSCLQITTNLIKLLIGGERRLNSNDLQSIGLLSSTLLQGICNQLGDSKPTMRQVAVSTLSSLVGEKKSSDQVWTLVDPSVLMKILQGKSGVQKCEMCDFLAHNANQWVLQLRPKFKTAQSQEWTFLMKHVIQCLDDKNQEVRQKAFECVRSVIQAIGYETFSRDFNESLSSSTLIDKLKAQCGMMEGEIESVRPKETKKAKVVVDRTKVLKEKRVSTASTPPPPPPQPSTPSPQSTPIAPIIPTDREKRSKSMKWPFTCPQASPSDLQIRKEMYEELRRQTEPAFSQNLHSQLFSQDFKQHICAMGVMESALTELEPTLSNIDLIFKRLSLFLSDQMTPASVVVRCLEYILCLIEFLHRDAHRLSQMDAKLLLPFVCLRLGDSKESVRRQVKLVLLELRLVVPLPFIIEYLLEGCRSKSGSKKKIDCLEQLYSYVQDRGPIMFSENNSALDGSPSSSLEEAVKVIARCVGDRDPNVRSAAIDLLGIISEKSNPQAAFKSMIAGTGLSDREKLMVADRAKRLMSSSCANDSYRSNERNSTRVSLESEPTTSRRSIVLLEHTFLKEVRRTRTPEPPKSSVSTNSFTCIANSQDCDEAINAVVMGIAHRDYAMSHDASVQLRLFAEDCELRMLLSPHMENLVQTCVAKLRITIEANRLDECLKTSRTNEPTQIQNLIESMVRLLSTCYSIAPLAQKISREGVKESIKCILSVFDEPMVYDSEDPRLCRCLNICTLNIIMNATPTSVYCSLLRLLNECCILNQQQHSSGRPSLIELVMKCLWRLHRSAPEPSPLASVDIRQVLSEVEIFVEKCKDFSELATLTVKSIIGDLVKIHGREVTLENTASANVRRLIESISMKKRNSLVGRNLSSSYTKETNHEELARICNGVTDLINTDNEEALNKSLHSLYSFALDNPTREVVASVQQLNTNLQDRIACESFHRHNDASDNALIDFDDRNSSSKALDFFEKRIRLAESTLGVYEKSYDGESLETFEKNLETIKNRLSSGTCIDTAHLLCPLEDDCTHPSLRATQTCPFSPVKSPTKHEPDASINLIDFKTPKPQEKYEADEYAFSTPLINHQDSFDISYEMDLLRSRLAKIKLSATKK